MRTAVVLAACLAAAPLAALAEDEPSDPEAQQAEPIDEASLLRSMKESLASDPRVADSLAARIARSSLVSRISGADDPAQQLRDIRAWIDRDPDSAAGMAVGLARDDASGTHDFEKAFNQKITTYHQYSLDKKKGIFGRLRKSGMDAKLMKSQDNKDLADEEQREILKTMFEGGGSHSNKIVTQNPPGKPGAAGPTGAATLSSGYYDRLSQANLRGYSPQLQALQSALNARRAPGAPKLIETGKLDYATLSYPAHGIKFDIANLERRLAYERNYALAKALGLEGRYKPEQLLDPEVEKKLKAEAAGKTLSARFARRQAALERAAAAARAFDAAALAAQDPAKITRALLLSLGAKQKEAARWITVASLEEELERLELQQGFLSGELLQTIEACPVDAAVRQSYVRRGEDFDASLKKLRADDEESIRALEADDWLPRIAEVDKKLGEGAALRKDLSRNIDDYRSTAYRLADSRDLRPAWRRTLDRYVERLLPSSGYARGLRSRQRRRDLLKDVFMKIAMGSLDAAHAVLASDGA